MPAIPFEASCEGISRVIYGMEIVMFSKSFCPFCTRAKDLFTKKGIFPIIYELDLMGEEGSKTQSILYQLTGQRSVPSIFAFGNHLGGCDDVTQLEKANLLDKALQTYRSRQVIDQMDSSLFDYDVAIIGGGSGGIACAKECAENGKRVVLLDYVVPSHMNTTWGLGGTCVNVGCIPKKLTHQAAIHGENLKKARDYGYCFPEGQITHNWSQMFDKIQGHIRSLNFGYRTALRQKGVTYMNALARISGPHQLTCVDAKKNEKKLTSKYIVLATGERPQLSDIPGMNYCITSDDLFWLKYPPGKTLVIGASYVALECAGALHGLGYDVTVMVRSIFLRGYDQEMAERVGNHMEQCGVKFIKQHVPVKVEMIKPVDLENQKPGLLRVFYHNARGDEFDKSIKTEEYNTVLFAIGRVSCTNNIGLEVVQIPVDSRQRILTVDNREQTVAPNVFALGDILAGKPQLTPVAIRAGQMLARRLCKQSFEQCDYSLVPTTVFTPLEYGAVGYSEEDAISKFGLDDIDVYYNYCEPLEEAICSTTTSHTDFYAKIVCRISQQSKIIGLHILAPNAGEITQGYAIALRLGATYTDFSRTFGIHPTVSEVFTNMKVSKRSGKQVIAGGC